MRRRTKVALIVLAIVIAIHLVPVNRSNPPVRGEMVAPPRVVQVLRQSCYDCHSNETRWPWYSYVAPVSWFLTHHVNEAREELNFSTWLSLAEKDRVEMVHDIWDEVSEGKMPLRSYLILHPGARLSEDALGILKAWTDSNQLTLEFCIAEDEPGPGLTDTKFGRTNKHFYLHDEVRVTQSAIDSAFAVEREGRWVVELLLTLEGSQKFEEMTESNVGKHCAMILDGSIISAPRIMAPIRVGRAILAGDFTETEARRVADGLSRR